MKSINTTRALAHGATLLFLLLCLPACTETRLATRVEPVEIIEVREQTIDPDLLIPGKPFPREGIATNGDLVDALEHNEAEILRVNCQLDRIGKLDRGYCKE